MIDLGHRAGADEFDVRLSHLVVATSDSGGPPIDRTITDVLRMVRNHMDMDVVFVSHFERGQRVYRRVLQDESDPVIREGQGDPLEETICQRVVDGRLPQLMRDAGKLPEVQKLPVVDFPLGAHLSTPVVLHDGEVYGTLCCFSFEPRADLTERDLGRLRLAAAMLARLIDQDNANRSS